MTQDSGLRTQDSGLRTQDSGLRTQDSGLRTQDELCSDIDFVIPWVDCSDPEWQKLRASYSDDERKVSIANTIQRYRDWGILHYWFRAVEKYAPWVRKIHFITCGQVPEWLNLNHPKLHFVRHEDYIPKQWLPTFSANPIELNIHRIDGLSEKFVYFNDDMFLNAPVKPEDFFVNDLPCDTAGLHPGPAGALSSIANFVVNDLIIIARHFDFRKQFNANISKWLQLKYGTVLLKTLYMLPCWYVFGCRGLHSPHTATSYLKSTFVEVWEKEPDELERTSRCRFREKTNVNQWLMEYWNIMSGKFYPRSAKFSYMYKLEHKFNPDKIAEDIKKHKHKLICINDNETIDSEKFAAASEVIRKAYTEVFPEKSAFEV